MPGSITILGGEKLICKLAWKSNSQRKETFKITEILHHKGENFKKSTEANRGHSVTRKKEFP